MKVDDERIEAWNEATAVDAVSERWRQSENAVAAVVKVALFDLKPLVIICIFRCCFPSSQQ